MARDYARPPQRPVGNRPPNRKPARKTTPAKGGGLPGWAGIVVGLAIGLVVAAFVWIERPAPAMQLGKTANTTTPSSAAANAVSSGKDDAKKPIALPPKQTPRFAFYEMLPSYEVVIPREDAAASAKSGNPSSSASSAIAAAIAAPGQYLIQVGAYKTRDEAEKGRANLALLGVESKIEQVTINSSSNSIGNSSGDQSTNWFRVRIGPEDDLAKAQEILQRLENNDIKGMLIKVKAS